MVLASPMDVDPMLSLGGQIPGPPKYPNQSNGHRAQGGRNPAESGHEESGPPLLPALL